MVLPQDRSGCLQLLITYCSWFFWSFVPRRSDKKNWGYITREQFCRAWICTVHPKIGGCCCLNVRYQRGLCDPALTHLASAQFSSQNLLLIKANFSNFLFQMLIQKYIYLINKLFESFIHWVWINDQHFVF
jgi:hypothetical protein